MRTNLNFSSNTQGILWMLLSCFWFAVMAAIIRYLTPHMNPFEMVFIRNVFALLCSIPWAIRAGALSKKPQSWDLYFYRTISGIGGMYLLFYALSVIPAPQAIALTFTVPLITTLFAILFLGEKVGFHRWTAMFIGFVGVLVILRPGSNSFHYYSLLVVATTICWAMSNIIIKKMTDADHPQTIIFIMAILMVPVSLPVAIYVWKTPDMHQLLWLFALGVASNQAQNCMITAYTKTDVNVVQPFDFSRLVFISIIAYIFFNEVIDLWTAIGALIIFSSSMYVIHKDRKERLIEVAEKATL